jgi:hypothetical protein
MSLKEKYPPAFELQMDTYNLKANATLLGDERISILFLLSVFLFSSFWGARRLGRWISGWIT